jgi:hypothetical protein
MMEAALETLVNFYQTTWCYNPEDSHLYTCLKTSVSMENLIPELEETSGLPVYTFCDQTPFDM